MGAERIFLDTSILVPASVLEHPANGMTLSFLTHLGEKPFSACISPQICREFMAVLTCSPFAGRLFSIDEALRAIAPWVNACTMLEMDDEVAAEAFRLIDEYDVRGKRVHDAFIAATMLSHRVKRLVTRNADDFKAFAQELVVESVPV
jgi:predicted nucleic acid-binding protein